MQQGGTVAAIIGIRSEIVLRTAASGAQSQEQAHWFNHLRKKPHAGWPRSRAICPQHWHPQQTIHHGRVVTMALTVLRLQRACVASKVARVIEHLRPGVQRPLCSEERPFIFPVQLGCLRPLLADYRSRDFSRQ